jgi:curved DNA-binding protein
MEDGHRFVDYYDLLQVTPNCDPKIIESAYRYFAKMYHPDHAETANVEKFSQLSKAYNVLRDPAKRSEYDRSYLVKSNRANPFSLDNETDGDQKTAVGDAEIHEKILLTLYKRRREHANDPGVVGWLLQEMLECSDDHFEFHVWYLKSKGFIENTEQGTLAVTIQGVDHVITTCRTNLAERLLLTQLDRPVG